MSKEQENNIVTLEAKVQTIYYEDTTGNITKHHHVSDKRINIKEAEQILIDLGINISLVLRVLTERIGVELTREELSEKITHSERFYQRNE